MTTLKEEEPFAFVVKTENLQDTCSFCFAHQVKIQGIGSVHLCKGCHVVAYCNVKCQKSDWVNHKNECKILKNLQPQLLPGAHIRLTMRILLKAEKELGKTAFNGRTWNSLEDHLAVVKGKMSTLFYENVFDIMCFLTSLKNVSQEEVAKAFSKVISNNMGIIESSNGVAEVGIGMYLGLSIHKHSCIPDSQIIFTGTKASLRSFDQTAEYSPNLQISHCDVAPWNADRKNCLKNDRLIECTCPLCTDENHIMNRMGSSCYVTCCDDAAGILDENCSGPNRCNKCGRASMITVNEVELAQEKIKRHLRTMPRTGTARDSDVKRWMIKTMDLLTTERTLSEYNFHIVYLYITYRSLATKHGLHEIRKHAHERGQKAVEYYLHEMDWRRASYLMESTFIKHTLNNSDFDDHEAVRAVVRTYGKDHPVAVNFKQHVDDLDLFSAFQRAQISEAIRNLGAMA